MVKDIKSKLKSIALLEAIISPKWENRYFSYDSKWAKGQEVASMRDGSGVEWFLWIKNEIMAWKYLDPELGIMENIKNILHNFPEEFVAEPAFSIMESSCLWYFQNNEWIKFGKEDKAILKESEIFLWEASDYKQWAEEYYEIDIPLDSVSKIFENKLTNEIIHELNKNLSLNLLSEEIERIGFKDLKNPK